MKQEPDKLLRLLLDFDVTVFTSPELLAELEEVLGRKKIVRHLTLPVENYLSFHKSICRLVEPTKRYSFFPDADDDFLLDLSIEAKASYIVTGDKKLIRCKSFKEVKIISLASFKEFNNH
jgi:putative PIN family toxin of toxin-antitoxin system